MTNPVPIAFCITELDDGGAERALVQIVTRLDPQAWKPHVICLAPPGPLVAEFEQAGIPVECLGMQDLRGMLGLRKLIRSLKRIRPQLLQTFLYHANIAGRLAAACTRVPHVVSGIRVAETRSKLRLRIDRWTDRFVDRHVCVGQAVAEFSATTGGLPRAKMVVIPNGVDHEAIAAVPRTDIQAEFGIPHERKVLLFVGRLDPQKDPMLLLQAFSATHTKDQLHLLFVGDGPMDSSLAAKVNDLGIADRTTFAGRRNDVIGIMKASDCLVLPSRWEGLPNVILEAMATGLPVIATRAHGSMELLDDGRLGRLVEVGDAVGLARAVDACLGEHETARAKAGLAQTLLRKEFTWDQSARRYADLYEELLGHDV